MGMPTGTAFRGQVSADCTTVQTFVLYGAGSVTPLVVGPRDTVVVESVDISPAITMALSVVTVFDDQNGNGALDAGELILRSATQGTGVGAPGPYEMPSIYHYCKVGTTPKILSSVAGVINCLIRGVIIRG